VTRGVRALAAVLVAGCAARAQPSPLAPEVRALAAELDSTFLAPEFDRAMWGVVVQSVDDGQVLYRRNAERLFKPASNLKIVTGAAALVALGAEFRWRTPILAGGPMRGDTLDGDLLVVGRGDPSLSQRVAGGDDVLAALRPWADSLRGRGLRVVRGRVSGDASFFPDPVLGEGWMWDDLPFYYAAPIGALQFNEAVAVLEVTPGAAAGEPARARILPARAPLRLFAEVVTAPAESSLAVVTFDRAPFTDSVIVRGRISAGRAPWRSPVSVPDPTRYFEAALTQVLVESGIEVLGEAPASATRHSPLTTRDSSDTLFVWQSITLRELLPHFEKPSQNQIGEALLRTMGGVTRGVASVDSGRAAIRDVLRGFGVPDDAWVIADGSGVSHYNYLAPDVLARTLFAIARRPPPDADVFIASLPVAGVDGTLASRLRGTAAQGNARAKTGDISGARTMSGYVTTRDGERLLFVLMANHFPVPRRVVDVAADHVVERLANFSRRR